MQTPLLTDLYQLTMAQAAVRTGRAREHGVFQLFFRKLPFRGGYAVAAGLESAFEWLQDLRFSAAELEYLASLRGNDAGPLFDQAFLAQLRDLHLELAIDAVPEGSVVFANEPLLRVTGVLWHAQLIETALLNIINFQTLVATKAARIVQAARGRDVLEFGARRAQGDAALAASRAAYIGGCAATSLVAAGERYGIPVRGTHAHSWVMAFDDELSAFDAYATAAPNNCVLLVDTYDTLNGVRNAITIGERMRARGARLQGIRLDSGDLAWLSIEARKLLDAAGFTDTQIIASNDLDEHLIESLVQQDAAISAWGVGTKLVTAYDEPALTGVYKLSMVRAGDDPSSAFVPRIKLSEQAAKVSTPGIQQIRRFRRGTRWVADVVYDLQLGCSDPCTMIDPFNPTRQRALDPSLEHDDLLVPVWRSGQRVSEAPPLTAARARVREQLEQLDPTVRRLVHPHEYPVGLCAKLYEERLQLIRAARAKSGGNRRPGGTPDTI
ncbi:MAG: nicotinate phosphoribosyltransferase [Polyangiales bacterium]